MIFYYSGCGNSKYIAERIAADTGDRLVFIPEAARQGQYDYLLAEGESLGFVWPVYCWAPPRLVSDFVRKLTIKVEGKTIADLPSDQDGDKSLEKPYTWLVCTCGDNVGYTEREFRKDLGKAGLELDAAFSVIMPETYVNMAGMKLDTPEGAIEKVKAANLRLPQIIHELKRHQKVSEMIVGDKPFLKTYITKPYFYKALVTDKKWVLGEECIGCGTCASVCPLNNITMLEVIGSDKLEEGDGIRNGAPRNPKMRPHWNGNCTTCEACYHACPKNAINFGKATLGKGQYRFPYEAIE